MSTPTSKLTAPSRPAAPPAPSRRVTPAPSRPSAPAPPARRPARPAVRLPKQPPRAAAAGREPDAGAPAPVPDKRAADDPRFKRVVAKLNKNAAALRKHPPAAQKAAEAQAASRRQPKERLAKAQENKVEELQAAEGRKPESDTFLKLLRAEIEKAMPKTLGDTEDFMDEDQQRGLKGGVVGNIDQQKEAATGPVKTTAKAPPDTASVPERPVTDLPADTLPQAPVAPLNPASGMPEKKPDEEVSLQASKDEADRKLEEAEVTPEQLRKANDPRFSDVLKAKGAVEANADKAPQKYRASEGATIKQAGARAAADERKQVGQMKETQTGAGRNVKSRQQAARERDEARRREVTDNIERMFNETKEKVEGKLATLETEVSSMFDRGLEDALKRMKDYIELRKDAWKARRYSGPGGIFRWGKDKLAGLPDEVKVFYEAGQKLFTEDLDALIVRIAAHVERRLQEAKDEVTRGQKRIAEYVNGLEGDLKAVGRAAEAEVASRFDELRQGVDDKKNDLARNLAQRYKDAKAKADEAIKEMREADKGLLVKLAEKIGEVVRILREFKTKIMGMLRKSQDAVALIVADPIGFLSNLLKALGKGFGQFTDRIEEHLKEGFAAWLFGSLAGAGIEIPKEFSLPGLFKFVLQVLGFTAAAVRARVAKVIGERNVALLEGAWDVIKKLMESGPAALWEMAKEYLSDLKEKIIDAAREWLVGAIIRAATTRLLMLFNPVGAIIQAIMMIYNTVMFFIERINQILALVEAIVESVANIALGKIDDAANWIEKALARFIPVIIAFLARLLGISGIAERIKDFITRIQTRVGNAVDKIIGKVAGGLRKLVGSGRDAKGVAPKDVAAQGTPAGTPKPGAAEVKPGEFIFEKPQGAHTIRIRRDLTVVRFSTPTVVTGDPAQQAQQAALESVVPRISINYPLKSLGRAAGPSGHVTNVKAGEGRLPLSQTGMPGYQRGDHRGHLIGDRFHGRNKTENLVPMHPTLNLSTFKTFENSVADAYLAHKKAKRGILLFMRITPNYPADDASNPESWRPTTVKPDAKIITLRAGAATPTPQEQDFSQPAMSNPAAVITDFNINMANLEELHSTLRALKLHPRLAKAVVTERQHRGKFRDYMSVQIRLTFALGDRAGLVNMLDAYEDKIKFR